MTDLATLHKLADDLARKDRRFNVKKGPGRGDRATARYMAKLNKAAKRRMGKGVRIEKPVMKGTRLTFDFFLPRERTAVEVSLHRYVSEFEKDLLKALLAKHGGTPIRKLVFFTRVEGQKFRESPSARAGMQYLKSRGIEVTLLPLRSRPSA